MTVATEMKKWYALAIGIRLVLVLYGEWQDRNMLVKYTDVDYFVFSDAAAFVAKVYFLLKCINDINLKTMKDDFLI